MSDLSKDLELYEKIQSYLISTGLDSKDAKIYVLALNKGTITSRDVSNEFSEIRQNTAITHLKRLAQRGFLEYSSKETTNRKPYSIDFKVINPRIALKEQLEKAKELPTLLNRYDEHWEFLGENLIHEPDIWSSKNERVGIKIGASIISGSKEEIKIYSHDCSWCRFIDIQTALEDAYSNGVSITVIAQDFNKLLLEALKEIDISLFSCEGDYGAPFCIIDNDWLILPLQNGTISKQFSMVRTNDKYLINNFLKLFETVLSCSQKLVK